jgi:hypothetical protein
LRVVGEFEGNDSKLDLLLLQAALTQRIARLGLA